MEREIERHLRWLMVLRVAAVSSLLLSVFILELVFTTGSSPVPFYFISLCTFALSFLYGVLFRWFRGSRLFLLFPRGSQLGHGGFHALPCRLIAKPRPDELQQCHHLLVADLPVAAGHGAVQRATRRANSVQHGDEHVGGVRCIDR